MNLILKSLILKSLSLQWLCIPVNLLEKVFFLLGRLFFCWALYTSQLTRESRPNKKNRPVVHDGLARMTRCKGVRRVEALTMDLKEEELALLHLEVWCGG